MNPVVWIRQLLVLALGLGLFAPLASAATPEERAQVAKLDELRADIADEVQLYAFDLVDELVWGLKEQPIFGQETSVVLAGVTVPVGLGSGLGSLLENHVSKVIIDNPGTNIQLVHCPECTAVVVHSGPEGTVVSRGLDNPTVLDKLGSSNAKHALFVDIEAEGAFLVLRARLTRLTPDLPIVFSKTLATTVSKPALLRQSSDLKSAADARQEYIDALHSKGPISVPLRLGIRSYTPSNEFQRTVGGPPPFLWIQSGVELGASDAKAWTASLMAGFSYIPQAYQGLMVEGRVSRLLTGRSRSLTRPDVYGFAGLAMITVWGPATAPFQAERLNGDEVLNAPAGLETLSPRFTFGTYQLGLDVRFGNRVGFSSFIEMMPSMRDNPNMGEYVRIGGLGWQTIGAEVALWF